MSRITRITIVFVATLIISIGGLILGASTSQTVLAVAKDRYEKLQIFTKVLNLVQQYYVDDVDTEKLIYGGIKGMLEALDPHTNFLPPDVFKEFETETSGEFGGIGIEITVQNEVLTVISPIEDTPAWEAGIKAGDRIVEINGESTKGLSLVEAAQKMRGKLGQPVRMSVFRKGFEKPQEFAIKRAKIKIKSAKYVDFQDGYAYVRLTSFIENTFDDLDKALKEHDKKNKGIKGLVIDLRNNPGGLLDQAIKISDLFLNEGTIVSTIGRNANEKEVVYAKKEGTLPAFPIIILINEYSASASEILAGALQDNGRAAIMGQRSFGKGSVQSVVKLGDGSGLKLTVARYYTPKGISIQAEGINPDIIVENVNPEAFEKAVIKRENIRREKDIKGHLLGEKEKKKRKDSDEADEEASYWASQDKDAANKPLSTRDQMLKSDFQAQQAYNYLRAWKVFKKFE